MQGAVAAGEAWFSWACCRRRLSACEMRLYWTVMALCVPYYTVMALCVPYYAVMSLCVPYYTVMGLCVPYYTIISLCVLYCTVMHCVYWAVNVLKHQGIKIEYEVRRAGCTRRREGMEGPESAAAIEGDDGRIVCCRRKETVAAEETGRAHCTGGGRRDLLYLRDRRRPPPCWPSLSPGRPGPLGPIFFVFTISSCCCFPPYLTLLNKDSLHGSVCQLQVVKLYVSYVGPRSVAAIHEAKISGCHAVRARLVAAMREAKISGCHAWGRVSGCHGRPGHARGLAFRGCGGGGRRWY